MNGRILRIAGWTAFAALVVGIGVVFLAACDLGIKPLFGLRYCRSSAAAPDLSAERERERALRERIHEAELRIAQLPACAENTPPPLRPPVSPPSTPPALPPTTLPQQPPLQTAPEQPPLQTPPRQTSPAEDEQLKIPERVADLNGCWRSERGDIDLVSDDAEQRPVGKVRICYCFGSNGRGRGRWLFTDGRHCENNLRADLKSNELVIRHNGAPCSDRSHQVPEIITCRADAAGSVSCDTQSLGRHPNFTTGEKYRRASEAECRARPGR